MDSADQTIHSLFAGTATELHLLTCRVIPMTRRLTLQVARSSQGSLDLGRTNVIYRPLSN